ncbi:hypothetical protein BLS_006294 [Venturia inaequalis]|uniref:SAM-dependent MTase RsmB/NOP-type domain-containing protein n=1 Tax=Venturia inaequalis TaxID=5025 RepID=A0A8H3VNH1_VENIN|nr:hypothetical protein BLS_006294 [Venturia inaequalis]KAE9990652.1 hypothetical protein EG327_001099 [Venturia inaequalis]
MSLYYEAADILSNADKAGGSLKSRIYGKRDLKSSPGNVYALVSEATKWSAVLKDVVEKAGVLREERKLTPTLAILLAHDIILSKKGVAAPAKHALRQAIERHRTRLHGEFTKLRIRNGFASVETWKASINSGSNGTLNADSVGEKKAKSTRHPRWVRINTIQTTWEHQTQTTFAGFKEVAELEQILEASPSEKLVHHDRHIPNLLALPAGYDLSKSLAYQKGDIIFQDKASCFPAYLLNPTLGDGAVVDACAAPGNKTTHLAAILDISRRVNGMTWEDQEHKVFAFERNKLRTETLRKMVRLAGADAMVNIVGNKDFLATEPSSHKFWGAHFDHIGALLLDPSCSGSGIVGRDDEPTLFLPSADAVNGLTLSKSKKRKRKVPKVEIKVVPVVESSDSNSDDGEDEPAEANSTAKRLTSLSAFQLQLLKHAMKFPDAKRIVYSTCSIHMEENESVVVKALTSDIGRQGGWRLLHRDEQVEGLRDWHVRGDQATCKQLFSEKSSNLVFAEKTTNAALVADACIRCERGTTDGTMGFFVAGFVRDNRLAGTMLVTNEHERTEVEEDEEGGEEEEEEEEEEWNGFSDDGDDSAEAQLESSSAPRLDDSEVSSSPAYARHKRNR